MLAIVAAMAITRPGPDKQFDRDQALGAALGLFWKQGYEATGISELLDAMGIGRQSMYNTFSNKRALFLEALGSYLERLGGRVFAQLRAPGSPLDNVEKVFGIWEEMADEHCDSGCLLGNTVLELGPRDPEIATAMQTAIGALRREFANVFQRAQEAGELNSELDPEDIANLVAATGQGAALLTKAYGSPEVGKSVLRSLSKLLRGT